MNYWEQKPDDPTGDKATLASGCGILACIILFLMFALIIWHAITTRL
jgi:hypothetical protein